eukprot:CAMPEP_0174349542 /NCGR_PEP_ID=MMETSP0811_2-20130205/6296_1 /TAXON_ID=73025 ORGANISM="Eutreptiella gymnastica-like, Strain CCMP1594" /NCGR_SAMPLE_ID=MMETSP0811_2 /ASSEMBLY_ACC=CAM_ASM_000667 /LENGTH=38 /DNA_ID= /DNA_START= /DNA_END= /DNA_ORIENTATION=
MESVWSWVPGNTVREYGGGFGRCMGQEKAEVEVPNTNA